MRIFSRWTPSPLIRRPEGTRSGNRRRQVRRQLSGKGQNRTFRNVRFTP